MSEDIVIKELPPQTVLSVRSTVSMDELPAFFEKAFLKLFPYLAGLGEAPSGPSVALYHGEPTVEAVDVEVCVPTSTLLEGSGDVVARELDGGRFASIMHAGPYDRLNVTYEVLATWIADSGYESDGPSREVYQVGVGQAEPDGYLTEILFPI
ncbi:MAG: GyrI-like domain-containing protein [Candidatus Geothermincolia bacterium]